MKRAFLRSRASRADLEAALERGVEGLLGGNGSVSEAAASPDHAFAIRPLLDAATMLRAAFDEPPTAAGPRAELVAQLHWTPQQRPSVALRLEDAGRALWRTCAAAPTRRVALPGAVLALVLVGGLALVRSDGSASAATLTILAGIVEQQTGDGWLPLSNGASVTQGAHLRVGAGSAALLTFPDGSVLNLAEHADIEVPKATSDGARNMTIDQRADDLRGDVLSETSGGWDPAPPALDGVGWTGTARASPRAARAG